MWYFNTIVVKTHGYPMFLMWAPSMPHIHGYEWNTKRASVQRQTAFHFISLQLQAHCFVRCHVNRITAIRNVINVTRKRN